MRRVGSLGTTWIALIVMTLVGGCAVAPVEAPAPPPRPLPAEPESAPVPPAPAAETAPVPAPAPPPETARAPAPPAPEKVLVLLPPRSEAFATVLPDLEAELEARNFDASHTTLDELSTASQGDAAPSIVIAVGSDATLAALDELNAAVVFCQVPDGGFEAPNAYGVASLPPLDLQLKAWRRLDPTLQTVGLVLGRDETLLATRAQNAAEAYGLVLELRLASSDQEAVYHFKRMAADVDGLWVLPDNTALSPRAIREMLDIATARNVQTLVFTRSLLDWGALLSVTATDLDLARTLAEVVDTLADDRADELPLVTPLSELEARVNVPVAERLGLDPARDVWIERSGTP